MKLTEDNGILSDSGHTFIHIFKDEVVYVQHSIAEGSLTEEDRVMAKDPEKIWNEFFRQSTSDEV